METQGQRIRRIRDEKGIKQKFVSETTGISQAHLSRVENDDSGVTIHTLRKIAIALGVQVEEIYVSETEKAKESQVGYITPSIDELLEDEAKMLRFMGGQRPDDVTMAWVRRSLGVIREEIKRHKAPTGY